MDRSDEHRTEQRIPADSLLPLVVRQRLWDQLWTRLLAPPAAPADRAPQHRRTDEEGGAR